MNPVWSDADRERAYTALCEAVSAAGREGETQFLARVAILLAEELSDPEAFARALTSARHPTEP